MPYLRREEMTECNMETRQIVKNAEPEVLEISVEKPKTLDITNTRGID
jgi:hypothetical protein